MVRNPIQFQPGLSLLAFLEQYGTEGQCRIADRRDYLPWHSLAADHLVPGDLFAHPAQERHVGAAAVPGARHHLQHGLEAQAQAVPGHARAQPGREALRAHRD